ncbi:mitogen-activated protein kinase kinase kinase 5-like [Pistacia vera]|uniref:mitogen-activated protein kinase kinase kinase 5-like n=1 Tax=Pistacia vera TaxID=55513 RepID=UPI00126388C3|nr:mitogen-activated protein kinase kinase kinase 5-like [Pistacia vera]
MQASGNAGNFLQSPGQSSPNTIRKLRRMRKLRHATDDELGLSSTDRSSPSSGLTRKSRSSDHWSSFAVPIPLPLPESSVLRRPDSSGSNPGHSLQLPEEGLSSSLGRRKNSNHVTKISDKSSSHFLKGDSKDVNNRRSSPTRGFLSPAVSPQRSNTAGTDLFSLPGPDSNSLSTRRRGFSHDLKVDHPLKLDVSPKSAPTSVLSSPAVSPQRPKPGDRFTSFWAPKEIQAWSTVEVLDSSRNCTSPVSPVRTSVYSADHSPLHSPTMQSPKKSPRSPKFYFPSHHQSLPQPELDRLSSAHKLPLPPGALAAPQSSMPSPVIHQVIEMPNPLPMKNQWQKGKLIGRGTFGSVYIATNRETGALCAMKDVDIIPDDSKSAECIKQLEQEIRVLQHLKHPNIVQYYGSEVVDDHFYIYLEYVHPGSINKYVRDHFGAITESIVRNFTRHILYGLAYLHSTKTIHRDIKGANLLVDASGVVKLADFGMAKHLTGLSYELSLKGSPYWMAPEVMQSVMQKDAHSNLALAVDIWSLGCTVIEMLTGRPPWGELEGPQAMFKVLHKTPPIPETLSSEGKDFLQRCFRRNPADRPSAMLLLEHPFVRNSNDQNLSVLAQGISKMNLTDRSHSPIDRAAQKVDFIPNSPGTPPRRDRKQPCNSETFRQCYTFNWATASHHSPCSTLGVNRSLPTGQLIHNSHNFSPSSNDSSNMALGAVNNHPCALSRTHGREVPHI